MGGGYDYSIHNERRVTHIKKFFVLLPSSSNRKGHHPLKVEIMGSNPIDGTISAGKSPSVTPYGLVEELAILGKLLTPAENFCSRRSIG